MEKLKSYIKLLEVDIEREIEDEVTQGLSPTGERDLHVMFENLEHAKEYLAEKLAASK